MACCCLKRFGLERLAAGSPAPHLWPHIGLRRRQVDDLRRHSAAAPPPESPAGAPVALLPASTACEGYVSLVV